MILHGIYENGQIFLTNKKLPKIKGKVEIIFIEDKKVKTKKSKAQGIWKDRNDMADSTEYVNQARKKNKQKIFKA